MVTIGTITYHRSENYGAVLQAYALQRVLADMGYISEIIDYWDPRTRTASFSCYRRLLHFVWHRLVKGTLVGMQRERRTERFRQEHLRLSNQRYSNARMLLSAAPEYDAYITGSDQVWNPRIHGGDPAYFLTFAPVGKSLISYGASFGISRVPTRFLSDYAEWIANIHFLSTRELEGREIIKLLTGRDAELVLDPTLLLDQEQWRKVAIPFCSRKPYILAYYMPGDREVNSAITEVSRHVSALTDWPIIRLGQKEYMRLLPWRSAIFDAGPSEYLGLFQSASFVVTNSFHGSAFAVIYRKPFLVPVNITLPPERALTSRVTTLLKTLKLEDRLFPVGSDLPDDRILSVNYDTADGQLRQERQRSIAFLGRALKGA
jgi:hypothetical protein